LADILFRDKADHRRISGFLDEIFSLFFVVDNALCLIFGKNQAERER